MQTIKGYKPCDLDKDKARNIELAQKLAAGEVTTRDVQCHCTYSSYLSVLFLARSKFGWSQKKRGAAV